MSGPTDEKAVTNDRVLILERRVAELETSLQALHRQHARNIVHDIQSLRVEAGDIVVVKLGDPAVGWIPGPDAFQATTEAFADALSKVGAEGDIDLIVCDYGHNIEVVKAGGRLHHAVPAQKKTNDD